MPTRRRRRSVAVLALVGVTAVGVGTVANYTDVETVPQNRFTAGTLDLTASPRSEAWTVDNMAPGDVEYRAVTVGNAGSLPLEYNASAMLASQADAAAQTHPGSPANGGLGEALHLTYRGAVAAGGSCGPAAAAATETSAFVPSAPQAIDLLAPTRTLAPGASEQLCFSFQLPFASDNRYQGDSANFTLTFASTQAGRDGANQPVAAAVALMAPVAAAGDASARVSYPAVSGADRYTIRVSAQDGSPARTVDAAGASANVTGLTNGTPYLFVVRAYSGSRVIAQGSTAAVTPMSTPAPVENLAASVLADGSITATWAPTSNAASPAAASYDITLATEDGTTVSTSSAGAGATSYTFSGLPTAPKYVITVAPRNASGAGAARSTTPMLAYLAPPALTGLTPVASGFAGIGKVAFDRPLGAQVTGVDFAVFGEDGTSTSASATAGATSATFSAVNPNTRYRVEARVRNAVGTSSVVSTSYFSVLTAPAPVRSLSAVSSGSGAIAASWTDPGVDAQHDAPSGYDVTLSRNGTPVRTAAASSTSVSFTGLASGGGYTLSVVAKNAAGSSAAVSTTAEAGGYAPASVTALSGVPTAGGGISLNWAAPVVDGAHDGATSYVVELRNGSTVVKTTTVTTTSASFTGLASGSGYTAVVTAVNAAASSAGSSVAVTAGGYVPAPATNLTPLVGSDGVITASWTAPVADATHDAVTSYAVRLLDGATVVEARAVTATSVTFASVGAGSYTVEVVATNAAGSAAAVTATAEVKSNYDPTVLADSPLAYYKLDDAANATSAVDSSGNNRSAAFEGVVTPQAAGVMQDGGRSYAFGTNGALTTSGLALNTVVGGNNTVEAWVTIPAASSTAQTLFAFRSGGSIYQLIYLNGNLGFNAGQGDVLGTAITPGRHHIVANFYVGDQMTYNWLAVDGVKKSLDMKQGTRKTPVLNPGAVFVVGNSFGSGTWGGTVDNVSVYPRELAPARLLAHYNAGK